MRSTKNYLSDLKPGTTRISDKFNTSNVLSSFLLLISFSFLLMSLTWADDKITTTKTAVVLPNQHQNQIIPTKNFQNSQNLPKTSLTGHARVRSFGCYWIAARGITIVLICCSVARQNSKPKLADSRKIATGDALDARRGGGG